jgi:hypothetical protein
MKRIAALFAVLMLANCSAGFNHEWQAALESGKGSPRHDLTGPWQGTWRSEVSGHHGELRCIVSRTDQGTRAGAEGQTYRFHYHATFMNILSGTYDVMHVVRRHDGKFVFRGDQKLAGTGGGLYHYEGSGTPSQFSATYRSQSDHGVFELRRP